MFPFSGRLALTSCLRGSTRQARAGAGQTRPPARIASRRCSRTAPASSRLANPERRPASPFGSRSCSGCARPSARACGRKDRAGGMLRAVFSIDAEDLEGARRAPVWSSRRRVRRRRAAVFPRRPGDGRRAQRGVAAPVRRPPRNPAHVPAPAVPGSAPLATSRANSMPLRRVRGRPRGCERTENPAVAGLSVGAPGVIRTRDTRFRKPVLYPLSYGGGPSKRRPRQP